MKILVTGSNGLLGQKLVPLLLSQQYHVLATSLGLDRSSIAHDNYQYQSLDITDTSAVKDLVKAYMPEIIINTAAMTQVDDCEIYQEKCWEINVTAVQHLIEVSNLHQSFLLQLSTDFIFDGKNGPYDENAPAHPLSYYGKSKWEAEKMIIQRSNQWAIVRTILVYGTARNMSRSNIVLWVKSNLESGKPIQVVNDQWRTPTLAEDLAIGCFLIIKEKKVGIFNISGKDLLTPHDMALKTAECFSLDKSLISKANASNFQQKAQRPLKTGFVIDKATNVLSYTPHSFTEGLEIVKAQLSKNK